MTINVVLFPKTKYLRTKLIYPIYRGNKKTKADQDWHVVRYKIEELIEQIELNRTTELVGRDLQRTLSAQHSHSFSELNAARVVHANKLIKYIRYISNTSIQNNVFHFRCPFDTLFPFQLFLTSVHLVLDFDHNID